MFIDFRAVIRMDDTPVRGIAFDSGTCIAARDIHKLQLVDYNIGRPEPFRAGVARALDLLPSGGVWRVDQCEDRKSAARWWQRSRLTSRVR